MDAGVRPRGHGIGGVPTADEPGVDDGLRLRVDKGVEGHDLVCQLQNGGGPVFVAAPGMGGNPRNPHVEMPRAPALGGHAAVREPRFRADDGARPADPLTVDAGSRGCPQLLVGREHERHGNVDEPEILQGAGGEHVGDHPGLHVGHAGAVGAAPLHPEGAGRRRSGGEHRVHVPQKNDARPGFPLVGTGGKHVAELLHPALVGVDGGLGDLFRMESRLPHPAGNGFPDLVHVLPVFGKGIHVYQPLDHAHDLRLAPVKVGIEFPGRALQFHERLLLRLTAGRIHG